LDKTPGAMGMAEVWPLDSWVGQLILYGMR